MWIAVYFAIAAVLWPVLACGMFTYDQKKNPRFVESYREDYTAAAFGFGLFFALMWPLGLPFMFLATDRFKHGFGSKWFRP